MWCVRSSPSRTLHDQVLPAAELPGHLLPTQPRVPSESVKAGSGCGGRALNPHVNISSGKSVDHEFESLRPGDTKPLKVLPWAMVPTTGDMVYVTAYYRAVGKTPQTPVLLEKT